MRVAQEARLISDATRLYDFAAYTNSTTGSRSASREQETSPRSCMHSTAQSLHLLKPPRTVAFQPPRCSTTSPHLTALRSTHGHIFTSSLPTRLPCFAYACFLPCFWDVRRLLRSVQLCRSLECPSWIYSFVLSRSVSPWCVTCPSFITTR
ncbi:hypothetical protein FIBSPDRAFT_593758 [Athelia psychrophila]|uniref:Uncharacterized protein n=1 Tax=Athelia psychrophila TaxID=1759441 RepID=A0A167T742_9AGAM|nr:hypothetical protein FIBSPDRAFT_593758 [Fibularhizoctonia sp. CBS 109695]